MRFSQRHGYTHVKDVLQTDSMDDDLRIALWNVLDIYAFQKVREADFRYASLSHPFAASLWTAHFKQTYDTLGSWGENVVDKARRHFFDCEWYEVYDLVEFVATNPPPHVNVEHFTNAVNSALEREVSAWRLLEGRIIEITSPAEVEEIASALSDPSTAVRAHLKSALDLLADRKSPDYRNSIKESISAVEAVVSDIGGKSGSLGTALKKLGVNAHPALQGAFEKLYGYTSDADGIRHALMDETNLESEDARFMLVACSAFVNYLREKARRAA